VVTGGSGFLGSHLCESLLNDGYYVICLDNFYSSSIENVQHIRQHPHFELMRHDVCFPFYVECDYIFNLACPASPVHYQKDPVQTVKTCVSGAINALGLAKRLRIPILQASTSEVYGDPIEHPQAEGYWGNVNPVGLRSCYDEGKRCAETLFMDYHRQHNVDTRIVRIFNTYGPRMALDDGRVVSNFICQALLGHPITVYGAGNQTRSFCFVSDLIRGLKTVMFNGESGCLFNLGNEEERSISSIADFITNHIGSRSQVIHEKLPSDDPMIRRPNCTKIREQLGWTATVSFERGINQTVPYFQRQLLA
jgi:UDP-glucuronate decarboxylase